jgi:hypothetical protein
MVVLRQMLVAGPHRFSTAAVLDSYVTLSSSAAELAAICGCCTDKMLVAAVACSPKAAAHRQQLLKHLNSN